MIIIQSKTGKGKSRELIKRFIADKKPSTLITDELTIENVCHIIKNLEDKGCYIDNGGAKNIKTQIYANCDADYYDIIGRLHTDSLYLDIHIPRHIFESIKQYCLSLEHGYGYNIVLVEQLPVNSDIDEINIVTIK